MTPWHFFWQCKSTPVLSHGSVFVYLLPPENLIVAESYWHEFTPVTVSEAEFHSAARSVSYKRRMNTRFGRNWLLDGLVCVARKSSFSESKTVSFSNPRAQASDSFSSVVMRNTN